MVFTPAQATDTGAVADSVTPITAARSAVLAGGDGDGDPSADPLRLAAGPGRRRYGNVAL